MSFVSNLPLEFAGANQNVAFKDCDNATFAKFLERLKLEHKSATREQVGLMHFAKADLSLHDASTHAKGKLHNFVVKALGEIAYNLDSLYRAVVEDCRTRSKYTGDITSFEDLVRYKAICRADVDNWLVALGAHATMPEWGEIASDLTFDAMRKLRLRAEWMKYRAKALDAGDEAIRSLRRDIRGALSPIADGSLSLNALLDAVLPVVKPAALKNLSPYSDDRLIVMILYEVAQYAAAGELQSPDQKPADQAS